MIVAFQVLSACAAFADINPHVHREPLHGPVRTVVIERAQPSKGGSDTPETQWLHFEATHDGKGRILEETEYTSIGRVIQKYVWT